MLLPLFVGAIIIEQVLVLMMISYWLCAVIMLHIHYDEELTEKRTFQEQVQAKCFLLVFLFIFFKHERITSR